MSTVTDEYLAKTGLSYFWGRIKTIFATKTELGDKVDKVAGKGLSTEDYTSAEKTKLTNIQANAQVNAIDSVSVNNTALTPDANKNVNVIVPTATSQLTNDNNFQNATQVSTAIQSAISGITGITFNFDYSSFEELPAVGEVGTIYFIPDATATSPNVYTEYVWNDNDEEYEQIGSAEIDVDSLWSKSDLTAITTAEIDTILAN